MAFSFPLVKTGDMICRICFHSSPLMTVNIFLKYLLASGGNETVLNNMFRTLAFWGILLTLIHIKLSSVNEVIEILDENALDELKITDMDGGFPEGPVHHEGVIRVLVVQTVKKVEEALPGSQ